MDGVGVAVRGIGGAMKRTKKSRKAEAADPLAPEPAAVASDDRDDTPRKPGGKPLWLRPVTWVAGIIVAALGVALSNLLVPFFGGFLERATTTGEPVRVDNVRITDLGGNSFAFPDSAQFSGRDLAELNSSPDPAAWLESRGGVRAGALWIQLTVSGNRPDGVRILDLKPAGSCSTPHAGTLFVSPPAGGENAQMVFLHLDNFGASATYRPEGADPMAHEERPYFLDKTISLKKDEQFVLLVMLDSKKSLCSVELDFTVLDAGKTVSQRVSNQGAPFTVTAELSRQAWQQTFLGGVMCTGDFVPATDAWLLDQPGDPCGAPLP
ncbi:hypothetical protein [Arthrobacter sp. CJ23]|uniref:hypothetical protein n=1 Tax=Arthrobacter sp. CJ23 TaxID=2972479 RepID=UPI00215C9597|nr:hypothetical protein [Arthrobacter sp. CJ23]UVJ39123.1 hypothetical protein NVV90_18240 [Arthrobacter sp. CJ23]